MKGKKILVTGGAGFIGSNLVKALSGDNDVTVVDNLHTGKTENLSYFGLDDVRFIKDDVKNVNKLERDFDFIFHLGMYSSSPMYRENRSLVAEVLEGVTNILEYCKENGSSLVFASTSSIYNGISPPHREGITPLVTDYYTEARIGAERLSELYNKFYGVNSSAMRFFSVYGYNDQRKGSYANLVTQFILTMKGNEKPIIYGNGEQRRDFVFVTDVVDALIRASDRKGFNVYNVGTGINYSLNDVVKKINEEIGRKISPTYSPLTIKNYVSVTLADTSKSKTELGFEAKVNLDRGIELMNEMLS